MTLVSTRSQSTPIDPWVAFPPVPPNCVTISPMRRHGSTKHLRFPFQHALSEFQLVHCNVQRFFNLSLVKLLLHVSYVPIGTLHDVEFVFREGLDTLSVDGRRRYRREHRQRGFVRLREFRERIWVHCEPRDACCLLDNLV